MSSNEASAFWIGSAIAAFLAFTAFQATESACQTQHDVADCEWTRSPFTPVNQKEPQK